MKSPLILLLMALAAMVSPAAPAAAQESGAGAPNGLVVLRGHVVCLDAAAACDGPAARYAIADGGGQLHAFFAGDAGTAMFADARVRRRELQVTAQKTAKNELEVVHVQSVRDGKLYDIYYFCELCNIRAYAPGLCPCCRNEMEFRETPATEQ